jgi:hypothetical protein
MGVELRKPKKVKSSARSVVGARVARKARSAVRTYRSYRDRLSPKKVLKRGREKLGEKLFGRWRAWKQVQREKLWAKVHRSQSLKVVRDANGNVLKLREGASGRPVKVR